MLTLQQLQQQTKKMGVPIATRTFWKYVEWDLLPAGQKVAGHGNLLYFPDETMERVLLLHALNKEVGLLLPILRRSLLYWLEGEHWADMGNQQPSAFDLIVWFAGTLVKMELLHKQSLDQQDLASLNARVKKLFRKLGVASGNGDIVAQEVLSLDSD